jgi:hypothetical protein
VRVAVVDIEHAIAVEKGGGPGRGGADVRHCFRIGL